MMHLMSSAPFELVSIDFQHLDKSKGEYDYFIEYVQAYATPNNMAHTGAKKICNELIPRFTFPTHVHHDPQMYIMRTNCSTTSNAFVELLPCEPLQTTQRAMAR